MAHDYEKLRQAGPIYHLAHNVLSAKTYLVLVQDRDRYMEWYEAARPLNLGPVMEDEQSAAIATALAGPDGPEEDLEMAFALAEEGGLKLSMLGAGENIIFVSPAFL